MIIGIDIGGTKCAVARADDAGAIQATKTFTSQIINAVYKKIRIGLYLSLFFCVMICDIIAFRKMFSDNGKRFSLYK